jgi:phosphorylase kinase alpha/beta subunit
MTGGEPQFAQLVERLLNQIDSPSYRQLSVEALGALMAFAEANPELELDGFVILDVVISHAVRLCWQHEHTDQIVLYNQHRGGAWQSFYQTSPGQVRGWLLESFAYLVENAREMA